MTGYQFKIENLFRATQRLSEACARYDPSDDIVRDSIIQRFEFTFTVAYAALRAYMESRGAMLGDSFPRTVLKTAYANGLIADEESWLGILADRNSTSHIYSEKMADRIASRIVSQYLPAFVALCDILKENEA